MNLLNRHKVSSIVIACVALAGALGAQQAAPSPSPQAPQGQQPAAAPVPIGVDSASQTYELAPNDQILVHAPDADELNDKPFRIDDDGTVTLPLVGVVKAAGLTVQQFGDDLRTRLRTFIRNPLVSITVVQFRNSPVFFIGEFQRPGAVALQGRHTLVEMLMNGGGLLPTASRRIKITRKDESGPIPLPGAVQDPDTKTSSVEISLAKLSENINPAEDIVLQPYDVIFAERAEMVYTEGALGKNGGFEIGAKESVSVLQLLSLAGGLAGDAEPEKAVVLRPVLDTDRRAEIKLDLTKILATEGTDFPILPNDILVVPHKKPRSAALGKIGLLTLSIIPSLIISLLVR